MPSKKEKEALAKEKELLGEAHKIFERFARVKTDKKQAKAMLSKELLTDLVKQMQKEMRIAFVSEAKLKRFLSARTSKSTTRIKAERSRSRSSCSFIAIGYYRTPTRR